jgi:hypothetical protein
VGAVFFANFHEFSAPGIFPFPPPPTGLVGGKWNSIGFSTWNSTWKLHFPSEYFIFRVVLQVMLESTFGIEGVVARGFFKSGQLHKAVPGVQRRTDQTGQRRIDQL